VPELILASSSPRRIELLSQLNLNFSVVSPEIDETLLDGESNLDYVSRMSKEKAGSVFTSQVQNGINIVLGGDTVVIIDGVLLGKPADKNSAIDMLLRLSGSTHQVVTSISVTGEKKNKLNGDSLQGEVICTDTLLVETNVRFRVLAVGECERYWDTGEPQDKAGAYGIQGLGAIFVEKLEGSYSNVVGLPLLETAQLLSLYGIECLPVKKEIDTNLVKDVVQHG